MNPPFYRLCAGLLLTVCLGVDAAEVFGSGSHEALSSVVPVKSRGHDVPATLTYPASGSGNRFPLVVMAHGHGGTRDEAGGFKRVADGLAAAGIASIRMDFPGCGESHEAFTENNLGNMLADIEASRKYAVALPQIDPRFTGLLGYSMGGRLAMLSAGGSAVYSTVALWTPVGSNGISGVLPFLGGAENHKQLKLKAVMDGFADFTTPWGHQQQLGLLWFTDLQNSNPLDAIRQFSGDLLVLYGDRDEVVLPEVSRSVVAAAGSQAKVTEVVIEDAGHGLGFYSGDQKISRQVVDRTVLFFVEKMRSE
jgi:dienelactone hydrolase